MQLSKVAIATGSMTGKRVNHAMVSVVPIGLVLICGGQDEDGNALSTAELYNLSSGQCIATANMNVPRYNHQAVLLSDGRVLIIGGQTTGGDYLASAEYFHPTRRVFGNALAGLTSARASFQAMLAQNGDILVTGGVGSGDAALALTELYVPAAPAEMAGVSPF